MRLRDNVICESHLCWDVSKKNEQFPISSIAKFAQPWSSPTCKRAVQLHHLHKVWCLVVSSFNIPFYYTGMKYLYFTSHI